MQKLFSPAIALMNRMSYAKKLAVIGATSLAAIAVVGYSLASSLNIFVVFSQNELKGLALVEPISRVTQCLQEHRGVSAMLLSRRGKADLRTRLADKAKEVDKDIAALESALPSDIVSDESFHAIRSSWKILKDKGLGWTAAQNFDAHVRLIGQLHVLGKEVADRYAMTLDPELSTYYLIDTTVNKLPETIERFGQLRAYSVNILMERRASEAQKIRLNILVAELRNAIDALGANLGKVIDHNPSIHGRVAAMSMEIAGLSRQVVDLVEADILTDQFAVDPEAFFGMASGSIDRIYAQLRETLVPMSETLIRARMDEAEGTLYKSAAAALLLFMMVAYLMVGIHHSIVANIRSLARSAHAFARGDLKERIGLGTNDELRQIGDSFNEMADGFVLLLESQRADAVRLRELVALKRVKQVVDTAMDGFWMADADGRLLEVNEAYARISGYTTDELKTMHISQLEAIELPEDTRAHIAKLVEQGCDRFETRHRHKDGHEIDIEVSATYLPESEQIFVFCRDITDRKKAEEEIHSLAFYDVLTGLPNRRLLIDRFQTALHASARNNNHGAVMFIDMDRFKSLNDSLGHDYGDMMLKEVARRIKSVVRETDTASRLGGDEFVVLAEEIGMARGEASRKAALVAEKIREALARPYLLGEHEHLSSPSIGVCLYQGLDASVGHLLQCADMAMYQVKESGRNAVRFFDSAAK